MTNDPGTNRRVLITGSRDWNNEFLIHNVLSSFHWMLAGSNKITLVSGGCPTGADMMCEHSALMLGWEVECHPAKWDTYGKRAGFLRNAYMVERGADICLAFILDASKGATMTADLAEKAGIYTQRYERWSSGLSPNQPVETGLPECSDPDVLRGVEAVERRTGVLEVAGNHR